MEVKASGFEGSAGHVQIFVISFTHMLEGFTFPKADPTVLCLLLLMHFFSMMFG